MVPALPRPLFDRGSEGHLTVEFFLLRCDCLQMGPSLLKVEAVRVRFLSYSEEAVRQRPFSLPRGVGRNQPKIESRRLLLPPMYRRRIERACRP